MDKTVTFNRADILSMRNIVLAFRDRTETDLQNRIANGGKYSDPEVKYMQNDIKEAKRLINLLYRKEDETHGVLYGKKYSNL